MSTVKKISRPAFDNWLKQSGIVDAAHEAGRVGPLRFCYRPYTREYVVYYNNSELYCGTSWEDANAVWEYNQKDYDVTPTQ